MFKDDGGNFVVSPEEMSVLRQSLFVTVHHMDPDFADDLHAISGRQRADFSDLLEHIRALGP